MSGGGAPAAPPPAARGRGGYAAPAPVPSYDYSGGQNFAADTSYGGEAGYGGETAGYGGFGGAEQSYSGGQSYGGGGQNFAAPRGRGGRGGGGAGGRGAPRGAGGFGGGRGGAGIGGGGRGGGRGAPRGGGGGRGAPGGFAPPRGGGGFGQQGYGQGRGGFGGQARGGGAMGGGGGGRGGSFGGSPARGGFGGGGRGGGGGGGRGGGGFGAPRGGGGFGGQGRGGRGVGGFGGQGRGGFGEHRGRGGGGGFGGQGRGSFGGGAQKRKVERYIEPSKWETEYDKALPQEILSKCTSTACGICGKGPFSDPIITKSHYDGKNHDNKVKTLLEEMFKDKEDPPPKRVKAETPVIDPTTLFCQVCKVQCTSPVQYESHVNGKQHLSIVHTMSKGPGRFHCEICNIFVEKSEKENHKAGQAHQKKYQRSLQDQTCYRCELCNVTTSDKAGLDDHLAGRRHKAKVEGDDEDEPDSKPVAKVKSEKPKPKVESRLHKAVQELVSLICDIRTMEQSVIEMEYDTKKAPLGKITTDQIRAGYKALKKVSALIDENKTSGKDIIEACNDFYTRIPHEFGFKVPPVIRTHESVKAKLQLLEALADIQVALKILSTSQDSNLNPVDSKYEQLKVDIKHLSKDAEERKAVEKVIQSTHAQTHSQYTMDVEEVFTLDKEQERKQFKDLGNKQLLFHGSRMSNWAGILGQGLRIAPPEAPVTGYMFGKGVYFADMSSKSANYCFTSRSNNTGLLLLCEVSLGKPNKLLNADYNASSLPKGCHSVQGMGRVEPSRDEELAGVKLAMGPPKNTKVDNKGGYTLQYNEYIVYNTNQIKMKYLARVKFNYKY